MHLRTTLLVACLAGAAAAQNTNLPILPTGNPYIWGPPNTTPQVFFDMTVNTTITLQGLTYNAITPVGTTGSIEVWITNPGTTTYVGNETNAAAWSQLTSGPTVYPETPTTPSVCFTTGGVLQPGTYGVAVRYNNVGCYFYLGNGTNQTFANSELSVTAGATQSGAFTVAPFSPYVFSGILYYALGNVPQNCATKSSYGAGCYPTSGSFYQRFPSAAATAAALNGRRLTLVNGGTSYVVSQGVGVTYIPPSASATALPANNNLEALVTLPSALTYPGGSTTQLYVSTNGYVSDASNQTPPGSLSYMPHERGLLDAPATMWALAWHDFISSEVGSGLIKWEQVGNLFVITWDGVESYPSTTLNPSRMQIQFDLSNGDVHYVWQTIDAIGGSPYFDQTVVGFSFAGQSPDLGPVDVTTLTTLVLPAAEVLPLTLTASTAPVLGTTVDLLTSNEGNASVGINFLSLAPIPAPGINLSILGAPDCAGLLDINQGVGNLISNLGGGLPGMSVSFTIPTTPSVAGVTIASQSVWLDPAANAFGIKTSNGVELVVGLFAL